MNRRSFLSMFGAAASVGLVKPTYFFAPSGEWGPGSGTLASAGSFLVLELGRLDQTLHVPLVRGTWLRDIDLAREGRVKIYHDVASAARDLGPSSAWRFGIDAR
jgi:hypothetical protein